MIEVGPRVLVGAWGGAAVTISPEASVQFQQFPTEIKASTTVVVTASYVFFRSVSLTGTTTVDWEVSGSMGLPDYVLGQPLSGTIFFDPGVELAVVNLLIKAAAADTPDKTIIFSLLNPTGGRIAGPAIVTTEVRMPTSGPVLIVRPDSFSVDQGTVTLFDVLANDSPLRDTVTITALGTVPQGSALRVSGNRAIRYTAPAIGGFVGSTNFVYTARDSVTGEVGTGTVTVAIAAPFAIRPDEISVDRGRSFLLSPLANDSPATGLELVSFTAPARGTTERVGTDQIRYFAPPVSSPYTGPDNFAYTARRTSTGELGSAAVNVTVRAPSSNPFEGFGPNSGLPWWSGTAHAGMELEGMRGRKVDTITIYGAWGRFGDTVDEGWHDLAGGTTTGGSIKLDGCFDGWENLINPRVRSDICPVWTYHTIPAALGDINHDLPALRDLYNEIADGGRDDVYESMVAKLNRIMLHYGWSFLTIRIMHEMNGEHYPHSVMAQYPEFIAAWRRVATILHNNIGPGLTVYCDWSCAKNSGGGTISPEHYPGDAYVDVISLDYYDRGWGGKGITSLATFNQFANKSQGGQSPTYHIPGLYGINTYLNFAKSRGKLLGVAEWGVMLESVHPGAFNDNPEFINGMFQFFKNNANFIAYENYFQQKDSDLAKHPNSRAKYVELWKGGAPPPPPPGVDPESFIKVFPMATDTAAPGDIIVPSFDVKGNTYNVPAGKVYDLRGLGPAVLNTPDSTSTFRISGMGANSAICGGRGDCTNPAYTDQVWRVIHDNAAFGNNNPNLFVDVSGSLPSTAKFQGFHIRNGFDGIRIGYNWPDNQGPVFENICIDNAYDDGIENDSQHAFTIRNGLIRGHGGLSWKPGGGDTSGKSRQIATFEYCLIHMNRLPYDRAEGAPGTDCPSTGAKRTGQYISPTQQNNGLVPACNTAGFAHKFWLKTALSSDPGGVFARVIMKNVLLRFDTTSIENPNSAWVIFPKLGDGVGPGSVNGSYYENVHVCWLGPANTGTGYGPWPFLQSKATLAAMGIVLHDNELEAYNLWTATESAFRRANGWNGTTFAWCRP